MSTNPDNLVPMPQRVWSDTPTPRRREALWLKENKLCHWCGKATRLVNEQAQDQATIDHVIPRYKGGSNDLSNVVNACYGCNSRRNTEDMKGLPDNSTLGKNPASKKHKHKGIALTGDEKKAIMSTPVRVKISTEDILREQRDQAQKEIAMLRKEIKQWEETVAEQEIELKSLKSMTIWKFIRRNCLSG